MTYAISGGVGSSIKRLAVGEGWVTEDGDSGDYASVRIPSLLHFTLDNTHYGKQCWRGEGLACLHLLQGHR